MFLNQVYTTGLSNVNTIIIIIRLISYKSKFGFLNTFFHKYKDKQTRLSLPRRSPSSTVDSTTDESLPELFEDSEDSAIKTQGQFNKFDSAGILQ